MSFKREGDDTSQLNLLKKRRVAELLSNDIPDDEAFLMRNGRYACTVCGHRPVFDTVDMLAVHRHGKKHQKCLEIVYDRKRTFALEVLKRQQQIEIRNHEKGGASDSQAEAPLLQKTRITVRNALLKAAPYDSRSKAHHRKESSIRNSGEDNKDLFFQSTRRQHLQMSEQIDSQSSETDIIQATQPSSLPGNPAAHASTSSIHQSEQSHSQPGEDNFIEKTKKKKQSLFSKEEVVRKPIQLRPYISKSRRNVTKTTDTNHANVIEPTRGDRTTTCDTQAEQTISQSVPNNVSYISQYQSMPCSSIEQSTSHGAISLQKVSSKTKEQRSAPKEIHHSTDCNVRPQVVVKCLPPPPPPQISVKKPPPPPPRVNVKKPSPPPRVHVKKSSPPPPRVNVKTTMPSQDNVKKSSHPTLDNVAQTSVPIQFRLKKNSAPIQFNIKMTSAPSQVNTTSQPTQLNVKKTSPSQVNVKKTAALEQIQVALAGKKTEKPDPDTASCCAPLESSSDSTGAADMTGTRRRELQHYLHLTSSGWKRDNGGDWIKDDDVEFDSDEEAPS